MSAGHLLPLSALEVDDVRSSQVLVIGSGIAGLTAALGCVSLGCASLQTTVVTTGRLGREGSSAWAQGGIAAALGADDSPALHAADTVAAGAGLVEWETAKLLAQGAPEGIRRLLEWGTRFDRHGLGGLQRGREAAHRRRRILHADGDATGAEIMRALTAATLGAPHLTVVEDAFAIDLVLEAPSGASSGAMDLRVAGALALEEGRLVFHRAPAVVLATGGLGGAFSCTTNPAGSRGDGLALALRAGARLMDLEMVQFHPTALDVSRLESRSRVSEPADGARLPLLTEALRGEGAVLVDETGARFLAAVHPDAELAPRDVVARAIHRHRSAGHEVFLDAREAVGERFPERFPSVYALCRERGLDPRHELLPVTPAAHYHMGGVATDHRGRTSLPGLWACGEVACTGVHGANRLASNSLLEGLVFGARVAEDVSLELRREVRHPRDRDEGRGPEELWSPTVPGLRRLEGPSPRIAALRECLGKWVGLIRTQDGLSQALQVLRALERDPGGPGDPMEERNLLQVARALVLAALAREESRGGHFREDFPDTDPAWRCHLVLGGEPAAEPRRLCLHRQPVGEIPGERRRDGSPDGGEAAASGGPRGRRVDGSVDQAVWAGYRAGPTHLEASHFESVQYGETVR